MSAEHIPCRVTDCAWHTGGTANGATSCPHLRLSEEPRGCLLALVCNHDPTGDEDPCGHALDQKIAAYAEESRPKRIQRRRTAGWRMPEGAVYVGRPTEWGNPWIVGNVIGLEWPDPGVLDGRQRFFREMVITPELAIALYRIAFTPDAEAIREQFAGRDLVCWCPLDQPCHADVLLEVANQ